MSTEEHENRSLGGYKAALHNPNVSEEAKAHAADVLKSHGTELTKEDLAHAHTHADGTVHYHSHDPHGQKPVDAKETSHALPHPHSHGHDTRHGQDGENAAKHEHHVVGGLKATISNPRTSDEAKANAVEKLKEHGEKI